jgi:hypothetical protein
MMKREAMANWMAWALLVAFGVAARGLQPDWNFTPTAALGLFAGFFFASRLAAALLPVAVVAVSNQVLGLPSYLGYGDMACVYVALLTPVVLGRWLRAAPSPSRFAAGCFVPAAVFYLTTNFAVWALHSWYPNTWQGLVECYVAAVPFFRSTLAGDLFYAALIFGAYCVAVASARVGALARISSREHILPHRQSASIATLSGR